MSEANERMYAPGAPCWWELATTSAQGARAFYTGLFGWSIVEHDMGEMGVYHIFRQGERELGGMFEMKNMPEGVPPHWLVYLATDDVDRTIEEAKRLGGSLIHGPHDVMNIGRMAALSDPEGAAFAVWTDEKSPDAPAARPEPGVFCWSELNARDVATAGRFYATLFGLDVQVKEVPTSAYHLLHRGERMLAGLLQMTEEWGDMPAHWMSYVQVADCDDAAERAKKLGGKVCHGPFDIPTVGRMAVLMDPQGAPLSIMRFEEAC